VYTSTSTRPNASCTSRSNAATIGARCPVRPLRLSTSRNRSVRSDTRPLKIRSSASPRAFAGTIRDDRNSLNFASPRASSRISSSSPSVSSIAACPPASWASWNSVLAYIRATASGAASVSGMVSVRVLRVYCVLCAVCCASGTPTAPRLTNPPSSPPRHVLQLPQRLLQQPPLVRRVHLPLQDLPRPLRGDVHALGVDLRQRRPLGRLDVPPRPLPHRRQLRVRLGLQLRGDRLLLRLGLLEHPLRLGPRLGQVLLV